MENRLESAEQNVLELLAEAEKSLGETRSRLDDLMAKYRLLEKEIVDTLFAIDSQTQEVQSLKSRLTPEATINPVIREA